MQQDKYIGSCMIITPILAAFSSILISTNSSGGVNKREYKYQEQDTDQEKEGDGRNELEDESGSRLISISGLNYDGYSSNYTSKIIIIIILFEDVK